jgi:hypothetical protein
MLMLKIIFLKNYFKEFLNKKSFEKQFFFKKLNLFSLNYFWIILF